jgi:dihydroneopterin aldolase
MDTIELRGMRFYGYHGVLPEERQRGQHFEVDVRIETDLRAAGENDDLTRTVDYRGVWEAAEAVVTGEPVDLIETVAERIAARILALTEQVQAVEVTVHKPEVPLPGPLTEAAVTIRRTHA